MSETTTLRFEGASDDTFGWQQDEYDNCASGRPIVWEVRTPDGAGLHVWGIYGADAPVRIACWTVGVQQLNEDVPMPDWPVRLETATNGYSPVLVIEVPSEDVAVRCLNANA
jgi:hypothetical protein